MIVICLLSLFIYGLNAQCGSQTVDTCGGADPSAGGGAGDWDCCYVDGSSCVPGMGADCALTPATTATPTTTSTTTTEATTTTTTTTEEPTTTTTTTATTGVSTTGVLTTGGSTTATTEEPTTTTTTTTTTTESPTTSTTETTSSTETICDDSDLSEWRIDYIGKSTQFRLYEPCDGKFIKFKMEDLTEYNGQTNKKTNNKETSFASSKDWLWGTDSGVAANYKGNDAILNVFDADQLTDGTTSFTLNTWFFKDPTNITDPDDENSTITITPNTLKFDTIIENWEYKADDNYLVLCIGVMTNNAGDIDDDPDTKTFYLQEFAVTNVETASCIDANGNVTSIGVTLERDGNGNNHLDLCYTFEPCQGTIKYDPIVRVNTAADMPDIDDNDNTDDTNPDDTNTDITNTENTDTNTEYSGSLSIFGNNKLGILGMVCLLWFL